MSTSYPVFISGAGPVGLIAAYTLAYNGIRCILVERNESTTKWPKMDVTNVRSMEILRKLGLADELRNQGVAQDFSFDVLISTGLGGDGEMITKWDLPSPNQWRQRIRETNDGSMPLEPYQRCSQAIFEAWLKKIIDRDPLIEAHWSTKVVDVQEKPDRVLVTVEDQRTKETRIVEAQYMIGCDGGGSVTRKKTNMGLTGGPLPRAMYLVHFKSRDLSRLHAQGQFWHIFFTHGGVIISQDEIDTWTTHLPVPVDFDQSTLDPRDQIAKVLGGHGKPYEIEVDDILVSSVWRPNNAVADRYRSEGGRVFIAGDAAHQNIPTGGYGMNTGLGDAYDIATKLSLVLRGAGGDDLLESYEVERRPVAVRNVSRAAEHMGVHMHYVEKFVALGDETAQSQTDEAKDLKAYTKAHVDSTDGENKDVGLEMDYRFRDSPVVVAEMHAEEPEWQRQAYAPSTLPGSRAPHVFLKDGRSSIYDLLGKDFTVIDFSKDGLLSSEMENLAKSNNLPLTRIHLPDEPHVRGVWERDVVLVRPDHFVAWRSSSTGDDRDLLPEVLNRVFGKGSSARAGAGQTNGTKLGFEGAQDSFNQDSELNGGVQRLAAFQT